MTRIGLVICVSLTNFAAAQAQHLFRRVHPSAGQRPAAGSAAQTPVQPAGSATSSLIGQPPLAQPQPAVRHLPVERLQRWWNGTAQAASAPRSMAAPTPSSTPDSPRNSSSQAEAAGAPVVNGLAASAYSPANLQSAAPAAVASATPVAATPAETSPAAGTAPVASTTIEPATPVSSAALPPGESRSIFDHLRFAAAPGPRNTVRNFGPHSSGSAVVDGRRPLPQLTTTGDENPAANSASVPRVAASDAPQTTAVADAVASGASVNPSTAANNSAAQSGLPQDSNPSVWADIEPMRAATPPPPVRRIIQPIAMRQNSAYDLIRALQQSHQQDSAASRPISIVASGNPESTKASSASAARKPAPSAELSATAATSSPAPAEVPTASSLPSSSKLHSPSFVAPAANLEPSRIEAVSAEPVSARQELLETKHQSVARLNPADVRLAVYDPRGIVAGGQEAIYEIHVNNHGPEIARNVQVLVTVDPSLTVASAQGPGAKTATSGVVFDSIPQLEPHTLKILRFSVRASQPGGHQFRVELSSTDPRLRQAIEGTTRFGE
jgi:hypothetical protein